MAIDTDDGAATTEADLRERVSQFLSRNFPQIAMHGGDAAITDIDAEAGRVTVALGGACSGCGISPMTVQALQSRLLAEIPEVREVESHAGGLGAPPDARGGFDSGDVPF